MQSRPTEANSQGFSKLVTVPLRRLVEEGAVKGQPGVCQLAESLEQEAQRRHARAEDKRHTTWATR